MQPPDLQSLSKAASWLLISFWEQREKLCTPGEYHCWCEFHGVRAQHWEWIGGKWGEDRRNILCGMMHWQVQRFVCVHECTCVSMCVCVLECVWVLKRAEDRDWKRERRYWVGKWEIGGERLVHVGGTIWWPVVVRHYQISLWSEERLINVAVTVIP